MTGVACDARIHDMKTRMFAWILLEGANNIGTYTGRETTGMLHLKKKHFYDFIQFSLRFVSKDPVVNKSDNGFYTEVWTK